MSDADSILPARPPFADVQSPPSEHRGFSVSYRDGLGLATVRARKGQRAALAHRVRERFNIELPEGPTRAAAGTVAFAAIGPDAWLSTCDTGGNAFARLLRDEIGAMASITDQTDAYAVLRLAGSNVRNTLCKLIPLDIHPRAFKIGDVAVTVGAHIGVTVWRLDEPNGSAVFEIAVPASMAASFWHALTESAAEYGVTGVRLTG
jgi:sarcosine oxidase subunit gamma